MNLIYCKMFGTPVIMNNNKKIFFPYKKAEALFYYMVLKKQVSRDELAGLFWADKDESIAKKNLRNAIYEVKKSFNEEVFISPINSIVMLNPEINIKSDVDIFLKDHEKSIEVYTGEFLQGFFIKDAEGFEKWLDKLKEDFREQYITKIYERIEEDEKKSYFKDIGKYAKLIIAADEFDEKAYGILMNYYKNTENYGKAVNVYNNLSQLLKKELGITPDWHTEEIFKEIMKIINKRKKPESMTSKEFFYGRNNELKILKNNYENFTLGNNGKSVIIVGEAGIGKTGLKDKFIKGINEKEVYIFEADCYQVEKEYLLKPWDIILSEISDVLEDEKINIPQIWEDIISRVFPQFHKKEKDNDNDIKYIESIGNVKYEIISDILIYILKRIIEKKKVVFIFEDIQWMDNESLSLLTSVILHQQKNDVIFIVTCRNEYDSDVDKFVTIMDSYNKLITINLPRFTEEEVKMFVKTLFPDIHISDKTLRKIYSETEGNTFFLTEYLNIIKSNGDTNIMSIKMKDILKSRFLYISEEGKKILNIASIFFDGVPLEILKNLTGKEDLELIDIIEELENKFILKELKIDGEINFKFTHQKLREFVYMNQSEGRKRILHNKIGDLLEKNLSSDKADINEYHKLMYHYFNGSNKIKYLNYKIKSLNYYLNFSHELFPIIIDSNNDIYKHAYFSREQTIKYLKDIEELLKEIKGKGKPNNEILKLEIAFFHIKGRYLIRDGNYEQGTEYIKRMIKESLDIEDRDHALEGYKQMIYFCIQTNETEAMVKYVEQGLDIAMECNYHKEIGILLRLKGLYRIMCGEYKEAEELLNKSINTFNITEQIASKYSLSIAASYNYIGEIRRLNMKFDEALNYYDKAIAMCENKNSLTSLAIFNINAGQAAFEMGDYKKSKKYFEKAYELYNQFDSVWRKAILGAFMALINIKENDYYKALECLRNADIYSQRMKNPHEMGIVYRVKAEVRIAMEHNEKLYNVFIQYLDRNANYYCEEGMKYLKIARENYEIEVINTLRDGRQ
ncbi:MAG: tetratricopeptide repeat protein [Tissierellaceae bacterium]|nr:tetratricopeptide repeat protein [Tissierellaceae bacterium]